jgi:hypothetical protein
MISNDGRVLQRKILVFYILLVVAWVSYFTLSILV